MFLACVVFGVFDLHEGMDHRRWTFVGRWYRHRETWTVEVVNRRPCLFAFRAVSPSRERFQGPRKPIPNQNPSPYNPLVAALYLVVGFWLCR